MLTFDTVSIPFYRSKEIIEKSKGNDISTKLFIDIDKYKDLKAKFGAPEIGDILLTAVGILGVAYVVRNETFYFKDGNLVWFKKFSNINSSFLLLWLQSSYGQHQIDKNSIGSTQKAITIDALRKFKIIIPEIGVAKKYKSISSPLESLIYQNQIQNQKLAQIRDTFLPKLMNGKVRVPVK